MSANPVKRAAVAEFVRLLFHREADRGMQLIEFESRCVQRGEIHEIVTADQPGLGPGDRADRIGFLGFAEFEVGGVLERGDLVLLDRQPLGTVLGFDKCHFPNHYNVIIQCAEIVSATEARARVGSVLHFEANG
jgi:hypothetical protein